jgi:hypothetical protein
MPQSQTWAVKAHLPVALRLHQSPIDRAAAWPAIALLLLAVTTGGCTNSALTSARRELAAKQYATAHQHLVLAARQENQLSAGERREVKDGLCLTEFMIGAPAYPLSEQGRVCAQAAIEPGSESAALLTKIQASITRSASQEIATALRQKDLPRAEAAALKYEATPGADPTLAANWSRQIWRMSEERDHGLERTRRARLRPAISHLTGEYPQMRKMGTVAFRNWIIKSATVSGTPMVSSVAIRGDTLELWVPDRNLSTVALNLNRFVSINDALVARCGCDGRTNVGIWDTGLPAYLLRLDPDTLRSEILILPHQ